MANKKFDFKGYLKENKLTPYSREVPDIVRESVDSSMLDMDTRAVKKLYKKVRGKDKKVLDTAIKAYNNGKLENDFKLIDKVADVLEEYVWEIFSNAPDDEVFIDEDSVLDIIDIMS